MRDFNFFRSYQKPAGRAVNTKRVGAMGLLVIAVLVGGAYGFTAYRMHQVTLDMERMQQFMNAPQNIQKYQAYLKTKQRLGILTSYFEVVDKVNMLIDNDARISLGTIAKLEKAMPVNVTLQSSKMTSKNMDFQGITDNRLAVADFEHNLIQTGLFKDVFVTNIDNGLDMTTGVPLSGYYVFTIKCELKEVMTP